MLNSLASYRGGIFVSEMFVSARDRRIWTDMIISTVWHELYEEDARLLCLWFNGGEQFHNFNALGLKSATNSLVKNRLCIIW